MNEDTKKWLGLIGALSGLMFLFLLAFIVGASNVPEAYLIGYSEGMGLEKFCNEKFNRTFVDGDCLIYVSEIYVNNSVPHKFDIKCEFINMTTIINQPEPVFSLYTKNIVYNTKVVAYEIAMQSITGCEYDGIKPITDEEYDKYLKSYKEGIKNINYCYQLATGQTVCSEEKLIE